MGPLDGKVAFVTGAARGQGRSHAVRLAEDGADVIAVDIAADIGSIAYPMASEADLEETVRLVEKTGRRIVARVADVRDQGQLDAAVAAGVEAFGRLDIVCANAGILGKGVGWELTEAEFRDTIDVNLVGVWHTLKAAVPTMIAGGRGGSCILTSSAAGMKGQLNLSAYVASKHGVIGLTKSFSNELAPHMIRVNAIAPTSVNTPMVMNDGVFRLFRPDLDAPTQADARDRFSTLNTMPVPWIEPSDVSNAVAWLASDQSTYVTGLVLSVDAGFVTK